MSHRNYQDTVIGENVDNIRSMIIEQRNRISNLVAEVCVLDEETGKITPRDGVSREQLLFLINTINKINECYNYSIEEVEQLNKELDDFAKEVEATKNEILDFESRYDVKLPKLIRGMYGLT